MKIRNIENMTVNIEDGVFYVFDGHVRFHDNGFYLMLLLRANTSTWKPELVCQVKITTAPTTSCIASKNK